MLHARKKRIQTPEAFSGDELALGGNKKRNPQCSSAFNASGVALWCETRVMLLQRPGCSAADCAG